jgi:polyisoprenoid-binding protein YceI
MTIQTGEFYMRHPFGAVLGLLLLVVAAAPVCAQPMLPHTLTPENFQLRFEVDSTWHMVHGKVAQREGRAYLRKENDFSSLSVEARFAVASFDTDNSSRDERLREVMKAGSHPQVEVKLEARGDPCSLQTFAVGAACSQEFFGTLSIAGISKQVVIPVRFSRTEPGQLSAEGSLAFAWAEYGVEDPSIFIARLNPTVSVHFNLKVPYGSN